VRKNILLNNFSIENIKGRFGVLFFCPNFSLKSIKKMSDIAAGHLICVEVGIYTNP